jgi:hypothetical protein
MGQVASSTGNFYPLYDDSGSKLGAFVYYYGKVMLVVYLLIVALK